MATTKFITFVVLIIIIVDPKMILYSIKYKRLTLLLLLLFTVCLYGQIPNGYYKSAEGKNKAELKTALFSIVRNHTQLNYSGLSTSFRSSDWHPATESVPTGYFWDMYSDNIRISWTGMNREHNLPKSWFGIASGSENSAPIGCDLHNLYPSDATANTAKSNYPLGEVTGTPTFTNGVVKVGANGLTFNESDATLKYNGSVFEPADEYKGDFARDYMYMVTCYEDYAKVWQNVGISSMLISGQTYPVFNRWAVNLLLKWSRQDPVSTKEIVRNNAVYDLQKNRNPFVDHPEFAEFIWGKYMDIAWSDNVELPEDEVPFSINTTLVVGDSLKATLNYPEKSTYFIRGINGVVYKTGIFSSTGAIDVGGLHNDMYLLEVYSATKKRYVAKFIVRN